MQIINNIIVNKHNFCAEVKNKLSLQVLRTLKLIVNINE